MTDNRVLVQQDGTEAVWCHRGDGWGIARLKEHDVTVMVISTETNPVVERGVESSAWIVSRPVMTSLTHCGAWSTSLVWHQGKSRMSAMTSMISNV